MPQESWPRMSLAQLRSGTAANSEHSNKMMFDLEIKWSLFGSVSDQFHFDQDPDPRIRFVEKRIRILIRPKIDKYQLFYSVCQKE